LIFAYEALSENAKEKKRLPFMVLGMKKDEEESKL
jgi:hypothetical protein